MYAVQVILQMNNYTPLFGNFLDNLFVLLSSFSFLFVSQFSSHATYICAEQKQILISIKWFVCIAVFLLAKI